MGWGVISGEMGWAAIEEGWRKGPWTGEEDRLLIQHVNLHGEGRWNNVAKLAGLKRNGKSCRLRWVNYLRPDLKRGQITPHEERIILQLHARWGNRWSTIARSLPGRTDNEIKNYWRTHFKKKCKSSSNSPEKTRARLLRRQQFQFQMQQQLRVQEEQDQIDMKRIVSWLVDEKESGAAMSYGDVVYPSDDQGSVMVMGPEEEIVWDGLWNLGDLHVVPKHNYYNNFASSTFS